MDVKIRTLLADEIECRIASINEKGLSLLLYKDARVDQRILDETFGPFGWKRSHQCIDGNLYCTVEILDSERSEWIAKQDVGTVGYTEKEKSQASDSFKRACFNWGIGRELYSAPFIWIPAGKANIEKKEGKFVCHERFRVTKIEYSANREIIGLAVADGKGNAVFLFGEAGIKSKQDRKNVLSEEQWSMLLKELDRTGVEMDQVQERYRLEKAEDMSAEIYRKVMASLKKTKTVKAA